MPVCPWCQADLLFANAPCRACGKPAPVSRRPAKGGEIPELDLSPRPRTAALGTGPSLRAPLSSKEVPSFPVRSQEPAMLPGVGGAMFDEDDIFSPGDGPAHKLELDDVRVVTSGSLAAALPAGVERELRYASAPHLRRSGVAARIEPTADEAEASAVADYGDPPESFWQAPLYAYRVRTRQSELRRQLAERKRDLARARDACEEAKVAFAERARPVAQKSETFAKLLEPIVATEKVMFERDSALSAEVEAHKEQLRVIDDRIAELEAELARAKADEHGIEDKLAEAESVRQRAEARVKRAEIEIRNANARAEVEGGGARAESKGAGTPS